MGHEAGAEAEERSSGGSGVPLKAFATDACSLSAEEFEARHASSFLLITAAELQVPDGPSMTEVKVLGEPAGERTASMSMLAYPVERTERSVGHLVTVGRAANNDVAIPDLSISRFHAFMKPVGEGGFKIQDANSTNGTVVNGRPVASQGQGEASDLTPGDNVRVGQVELTLVSAKALWELVRAKYR